MSPTRSWSLFLGYWGGVSVRGHISVALVVLLILAIVPQNPAAKPSEKLAAAIVPVAIYLLSVVLHIATHLAAARRCGARINDILIGPWGEIDSLELPRDHEHALHVLIAGVGTNLILGICGILAAAQFEGFKPESLLGLIHRDNFVGPLPLFIACKWVILFNVVLAGLNLIPFFPFDAAYGALRIVQWVDPQVDRVRWQKVVAFMGRLAGIACLLVAPLVIDIAVDPNAPLLIAPAWPLAALGLILCFSPVESESPWAAISESAPLKANLGITAARVSPSRSDTSGGGTGDGLSTALRRLSEAATVLSPEEQARLDDERMDDILAKLHERGMNALSVDEQETLRRVSQRYKNKRSSK